MIPTMRVAPVSPIAALGWPAWAATLAGFGLLCAVVAFWGLTLLAPRPIGAPLLPNAEPSGPGRAVALFGDPAGKPTTAPVTVNLTVLGIVAAGEHGSAVLSVGGRPGRAYSPGEAIDDTLTLIAVNAQHVIVGNGARRIELPVPPRPDTAILNSTAQR